MPFLTASSRAPARLAGILRGTFLLGALLAGAGALVGLAHAATSLSTLPTPGDLLPELGHWAALGGVAGGSYGASLGALLPPPAASPRAIRGAGAVAGLVAGLAVVAATFGLRGAALPLSPSTLLLGAWLLGLGALVGAARAAPVRRLLFPARGPVAT